MNKLLLTIAGIAALTAAQELTIQQLLNQANTSIDTADVADTDLLQAMIDQINSMKVDIASLQDDFAQFSGGETESPGEVIEFAGLA